MFIYDHKAIAGPAFENEKLADYFWPHRSIGSTNRFRGTIEEVILYNQELIVPTPPDEWIYSTANTADTDGDGNIVTNVARLFLFDYHNIRGKSPRLVCQSNECIWRTTV